MKKKQSTRLISPKFLLGYYANLFVVVKDKFSSFPLRKSLSPPTVLRSNNARKSSFPPNLQPNSPISPKSQQQLPIEHATVTHTQHNNCIELPCLSRVKMKLFVFKQNPTVSSTLGPTNQQRLQEEIVNTWHGFARVSSNVQKYAEQKHHKHKHKTSIVRTLLHRKKLLAEHKSPRQHGEGVDDENVEEDWSDIQVTRKTQMGAILPAIYLNNKNTPSPRFQQTREQFLAASNRLPTLKILEKQTLQQRQLVWSKEEQCAVLIDA